MQNLRASDCIKVMFAASKLNLICLLVYSMINPVKVDTLCYRH